MSRLTAIISAIVICLIVCLGWLASHYHDNATEFKRQQDKVTEQLSLANDTIADMQTHERRRCARCQYTKELSDAKKTINDLRRDVDSGAKGLRIAATCPGVPKATSSTGVDDAGAPNLLQTLDGIISITGTESQPLTR
jgi:prophage endopeptidase